MYPYHGLGLVGITWIHGKLQEFLNPLNSIVGLIQAA